MNGDRWQRIETVFAEALARPADARDAFLNEACAGEPSMRAELDSLLKAHLEHGSFLETASLDEPDDEKVEAISPLLPGTRLGAFEIVALIGAGGMGAVYHARDTRLDRRVALKVLTSRLDRHDASPGRLEREAVAISRLTHPHICTLHDIARAPLSPGGMDVEFLVMELVRGETLADVIARGPLAVERALQCSIEMADALSCAHGEGIVHRDLKPQNMMITPEGVKLLDFGLAQFTASRPTDTSDRPAMARVPGTVQYMAPEQIRGEDVDGRADVFSLGLVVHEMLSGRRAFERPTIPETLQAILNDDAPPLPETVPAALQRIVERCLAKQRELRFQSASDLAAALRSVGVPGHAPATGAMEETRTPDPWRWLRFGNAMLLAGLALTVALTAAWKWIDPPSLQVTRQVRLTNDGQQKMGGLVTDGSHLYLSELVGKAPALVRVSTAGGDTTPVTIPFPNPGLDDISPSGSELFVGSYVEPGPFPYWMVPLSGAAPRRVGDLRAHDVHPSPDGRQIVYVIKSDVFVSRADGGSARRIASFPDKFPGSAAWAPDGRRLRFNVTDYRAGETSIWEASPDGSGLQPLLPGWRKPAAECCGRWTPDGAYYIFQATENRVTSLWAISERNGYWRKQSRVPLQLTRGPLHFRSPTPGRDGRTLFAIGDQVRGEIMRREPGSGEWMPYALGSTGRSMSQMSFSLDGGRIAYVNYPEGTLWSARVDGTQDRQLTFPPMEVSFPSWAPDGRRLAFNGKVNGGRWKIYAMPAEGGTPEQLIPGEESETAAEWSPDGSRIVFSGSPFFDPGASAPTTLRFLDLKTRRITEVAGSEGVWAARWSPDGRYIVAHRFDFRELRLLDLTTGRWETLARGLLHFANWSRDSRHVFFESWDEDIAVIRVRIHDRQREKVGALKEFRRTVGPDRCWSGLTPDNSLLVLRDVGSQEVYALTLDER